jgi:GxxExxY protein
VSGFDGRARDPLTDKVIGIAIGIHRHLGPGLLESAYEECMCHDLQETGIPFERQLSLPVVYKGIRLACGFRIDLLIDRRLVVEIKAVEALQRVHEAQILTYLKLTGCKTGLLVNFNVAVLKDGIRRMML